jgi:hypothetical protein
MRMFASVVLVTFSLLTLVPRADAQTSHAAPQSALDAALQQHVVSADADRATVLRLLDRPEVQAIAGDIGLDLRRAKDAMQTADAQTIAGLATQAQQVEQALAGGQSITISTTLIIIALLVIILIIVAV